MAYEIRLENVAAIHTAVVRRKASHEEFVTVVPDACGMVWKVIHSENIEGAGRHVAVYLDDEVNLEVGVLLESPFAETGDVIASHTPSGLSACTVHFGPYGLLGQAHKAVHDWCTENGYKPHGPCWEIYGHWREEWNQDPSLITTEVYYRVARLV